MEMPEVEDFSRCAMDAPACLAWFNLTVMVLVKSSDKETENKERPAAAELKRKRVSLPKLSKKKLALPPRLTSTPLLTFSTTVVVVTM